jgi:branched-chain amino acid transport system permease protein
MSSLSQSIAILSMVLLGGAGTVIGPSIGAFILIFVSEILRPLLEYRLLIYGALIILIIRFFPGGVYGYLIKNLVQRKTVSKEIVGEVKT